MVGDESIVGDLQRLRLDAGDVSYGEIAARIARDREARGATAAASRIARSTVYDAFRPGRTRLNPALVAEIVRALGADEAETERWRQRCLRARTVAAPASEQPVPLILPAPAPSLPLTARMGLAALIVLLCVAVNLVGGRTILLLGLPLYLDMIGTAVAAIALGPWFGVAVAVGTHAAGALIEQSFVGMPYALVNVVGALIWAYGVRRWGLGRSPVRFLALNMIVAVSCTAVSVPMTLIFHHGLTTHPASESMIERLLTVGGGLGVALFSSNIVTSVLDKLITGFIALAAAPALVAWLDRRAPLGRSRPVLFRRPPREVPRDAPPHPAHV
ncbi:helix-turn-helix transcriptional regulator [Microbacterium sp. NPDC089189]|uniref:helix-turn-helix domain-containing protein n=1 Tax=Microbacterium sp. NPDC089189 TaxID=3154972 RepID=UPI003433D018